jgi:membrane protein DedA with SNARE-associated domain
MASTSSLSLTRSARRTSLRTLFRRTEGAPRVVSLNLRTILFGVSIFLLVASLIEIFEPVEFPFEASLGHLFTSGSYFSVQLVTSLMVSFGYGGLFILMFMESASLPIPSEVVLPFAGYLAFTGELSLPAVLIVGTLAGVAGALLDYFIALWLGRPVVLRVFKWAGVRAEHLDRAERWLDSRGSLSILISRFVPVLRSVISFPAGALKMKLPTFVAMTAVGAFGWSVILVYLGYSAGALWQSALSKSTPFLTDVALVVVAIGSALYIAYFLGVRLMSKRGAGPEQEKPAQ